VKAFGGAPLRGWCRSAWLWEFTLLPRGQLPRKVKIPASARPGHFRAKWPEVPAFETCNMLYFDLEMYSSAPIEDMGRRGRSAVDE